MCINVLVCLFVCLFLFLAKPSYTTTVDKHTQILNKIFQDYNKIAIPQANTSHPVTLNIGIGVITLIDLVKYSLTYTYGGLFMLTRIFLTT